MAVTFSPPVGPTPPYTREKQPRLLEAQFGDGYAQSAPDGLNYEQATLPLHWENLTSAEADQIEGFFDARKGSEPFTYQPPHLGAAMQWRCRKWSREVVAFDVVNIAAELERDFGL